VSIQKADGFAMIDVVFVCGIVGLLSSISAPSLFRARQAAGAASAIGSMRAINSAELTFALTCGAGFYAPNLTTLGTPPAGSNEPFISSSLGGADTVVRSSYQIQLSAEPFPGAPPSCNGLEAGEAGRGFRAAADPTDGENSRHFATNAGNIIYEGESSLWAAFPEVGDAATGHVMK
jgi:type II secretory pathway pseudopilin PulG